jgi:cation:H+ antiporter
MAEVVMTSFVINIVVIAVSFIVLNWSSNLTISNALKVSSSTQLGKTSIGFSLIAFSTSLPELTVALAASLSNGSGLSVGNVLGSNIVNISIVLGIGALLLHLKKIKGKLSFKQFFLHLGSHLKPRKGSKDTNGINVISSFAKSELSSIYFGLFVASIVPMILIYISNATWAVGLILLFIFVGYMYQLSRVRIPGENGKILKESKKNLSRYVGLTIAGALGVVVSAYFLVESAVSIATSFSISQQVIGATIIAVGTSLPELTIGLKAFLQGHPGLAIGDIIGSSFVNITLILGITFFVPWLIGSPIILRANIFENLVIFSILTNLFFWYFLSREKIGWREGAIFLFIYILFIISNIGSSAQII